MSLTTLIFHLLLLLPSTSPLLILLSRNVCLAKFSRAAVARGTPPGRHLPMQYLFSRQVARARRGPQGGPLATVCAILCSSRHDGLLAIYLLLPLVPWRRGSAAGKKRCSRARVGHCCWKRCYVVSITTKLRNVDLRHPGQTHDAVGALYIGDCGDG